MNAKEYLINSVDCGLNLCDFFWIVEHCKLTDDSVRANVKAELLEKVPNLTVKGWGLFINNATFIENATKDRQYFLDNLSKHEKLKDNILREFINCIEFDTPFICKKDGTKTFIISSSLKNIDTFLTKKEYTNIDGTIKEEKINSKSDEDWLNNENKQPKNINEDIYHTGNVGIGSKADDFKFNVKCFVQKDNINLSGIYDYTGLITIENDNLQMNNGSFIFNNQNIEPNYNENYRFDLENKKYLIAEKFLDGSVNGFIINFNKSNITQEELNDFLNTEHIALIFNRNLKPCKVVNIDNKIKVITENGEIPNAKRHQKKLVLEDDLLKKDKYDYLVSEIITPDSEYFDNGICPDKIVAAGDYTFAENNMNWNNEQGGIDNNGNAVGGIFSVRNIEYYKENQDQLFLRQKWVDTYSSGNEKTYERTLTLENGIITEKTDWKVVDIKEDTAFGDSF